MRSKSSKRSRSNEPHPDMHTTTKVHRAELLHTRLLAKHPGKPMKALWKALIDNASCEVAMAIVNDPRCGIERRTTAADGVTLNPDFGIWLAPLRGGATPLMLAALADRDDVIEALLSLNAAVDAREDKYGYTALHIAAVGNNSVAIEMLIAKGSDMHARDNEGWIPLHRATYSGNSEAIKLLIASGSGVNSVTSGGWGLLHCRFHKDTLEAVELLIASGCDLNATDRQGWTPLHYAATTGNSKLINLLSTLGSDVSAVENDGNTPLYWAIHGAKSDYDNLDAQKLLIAEGSDVRGKRAGGQGM